jgi:uncharacterized protein (TIGR02266 family)
MEMIDGGVEARIDRRSDARLRVAVEVSLDSESQIWTGISADVSRGGIFVATWRSIPIGTDILVELELPSGVVRASGTVRWRREHSDNGPPPGVGVAFDEIEMGGREALEAFCATRAPLYHDGYADDRHSAE